MLAWCSTYLVQPDGPDAGQMFRFTREQVRILLRWYEIDETGHFLSRRGVLRRMKGWGKDPFLAAIALVELCGPCRFDGWDDAGMPKAAQHSAPWIQIAAVSRDQTRNTMRLFPGMVSKALQAEYKLDMGKEIIYFPGRGQIESVTSNPRTLEGGRPTLVIANETHHWISTNDGLEMMGAIRRNLAKGRDGAARVMEITNAHLPDEESAAEGTYVAWMKSGGKLPGVYYDSVEAPPIEDIDDEETVKAGLLAARGDSTWVNVDRLWEEISDPTTTESFSRRWYLNQVTKQGAGWLPDGLWEQLERDVQIPDHARVVLGFDGSHNGDYTALVAVSIPARPTERPIVEVIECWEPTKQDVVDIEEVEDVIKATCRRFQVIEIIADPYRWMKSLQSLEKEGLPVVEFPQNESRMIPATARFYEAAVNLVPAHNGDPRLAWQIANCTIKESNRGVRLQKPKAHSPRKIDLAIAAVMAFDRAMTHAAAGSPGIWDLNQIAADLKAADPQPQQQPAKAGPVAVFHPF